MRKVQLYDLAVLLLFVFGASLPAFSSMHVWQNTDLLMGVMVSVWDWTPFFPGQGRLGMLVPLLTSWIRQPFINMLAQTLFQLAALFGSLWLLDILLFSLAGPDVAATRRVTRVALAATLLIAALQTQIIPATTIYISAAHPYAQGICLMTAALVWLLHGKGGLPTRFAGFVVLLFLAIWVNESVAAYTLVLLWLGSVTWVRADLRRTVIILAVLSTTVVLIQLLVRVWASTYQTPISLLWMPLNTLPDALRFFGKQLSAQVVHVPMIGLIILLCAAASIIRGRRRRWGITEWRLAAFAAAAAIVLCVLALNGHVATNSYGVRYSIGSLLLALLPACVYGGFSIAQALRFQHAHLAAVALFVALSLVRFGWPSTDRVYTALQQGIGAHDKDVRTLGCTHIYGSYFFSWTSMFYRLLTDPSHIVYPVSRLSETVQARWTKLPESQRIYCAACDDDDAPGARESFNLHMGQPNRRAGVVCSYAPAPPAP